VANVLVYIELVGDRPAAASLEALGEGRRIASFLGATLYAALPCVTPPDYGEDDIIAVLGRHGADKVVLIAGPELTGAPLHVPFGYALAAVCDQVPPSLVLMAATTGGRDIAPRLAARLGGAFVAEPSVEYGPRGDLVLSRRVFGATFRRRLAADDVERPVVATLTPGSYHAGSGEDEAEVVVVQAQHPFPAPLTEVGRRDDSASALEGARVVVTAGAGVNKEAWPLIEELARALGGEVALTHGAVAAGLGDADREVGVGGRSVAPRLYVACGAAGSPAHLAAVSPDAQIVAINRDPAAPIFRIASYGLVGDVETVIPQLLRALAEPVAQPDLPVEAAP
jgi:electron transfer flavoprotein alpha subunit